MTDPQPIRDCLVANWADADAETPGLDAARAAVQPR